MSSIEPTDPTPGMPTGKLETGTIVYQTSFLPSDPQHQDLPSPEAYFASQNIPCDWRLQFNGQRLRIDEITHDWGWLGKSIILLDRKADSGIYGKELQCFQVKVPYSQEPQPETFEEVDRPEIKVLQSEVQVRGYNCTQVTWQNENEAWEVWFTVELILPDDLPLPYRLEGIEGTIVKMLQTNPLGVKKIELIEVNATPPKPESFALEDTYRVFENLTEARAANKACVEEQLAAKPETDPAAFQGFWILEGINQEIKLQIEIENDQVTLTQFPHDRDTPQVKKGQAKGNWIYLPQGKGYEIYELQADPAPRLVHLTPPYSIWKKVEE